MKHQACALLLLVSFSVYADFDMQIIADKSKRVGRFSYEDSFDENLVETVLKNSSAAVKRNVKRLLYPDVGQQEMQRLLLLGGTSNASTTAIAKSIATRCGYEYYVVEASALLQEYREGRQMLLSEVRPIIKQGKPIAIIITELPEMTDYSGLLASTLWLLIDQCAQYPDVFVIGTSAFQKGQLSEEIKERFGSDIISVALDKSMQDSIENAAVSKASWLERNKVACLVMGGLMGLALTAAHLYAQMMFIDTQIQQKESENILLEQKIIVLDNEIDRQNKILLAVVQAQQQREEEKDQTIIALSNDMSKKNQLLLSMTQSHQQNENEKLLLEQKNAALCNDMNAKNQLVQKQEYTIKNQECTIKSQQCDMQKQQVKSEELEKFKQKKLQEEEDDRQNNLKIIGSFALRAIGIPISL